MKCPFCGSEDTKVIDSRAYSDGNSIKRRRECEKCEKRFTTHEKVAELTLYVIKKDGIKQSYSREKVRNGILRALEKRKIDSEKIEDAIDKIEREILTEYSGEINSRDLGNIIMSYLLDLDEIAYVRFASVYKKFDNLESFIKEIEKIVKADIYGMLRKFLNTYYNEGVLFEYSLIKLSGQSTKINTFQEVLKEFVPGKMIEYKELSHRDDYELKLNCLDGAIKYLDYKRFGHMEVNIENEVPLVPYSVWVEKYTGEKFRILQTSRKADILMGYIDKSISAMELKIYLHNAEGDLKKEMIYKNEINYVEKDAEEIIPEFKGVITQNNTDTIPNNTVRFFVYTDMNNWGFFVCPVQRRGNQLYLGKKEYFPYGDSLMENSYFDGEH